jgi:hypothetical protein
MITITPEQWTVLKQRLTEEYPPSVMLIRGRMREVLGFVPREHNIWLGYYEDASPEDRSARNYGYRKVICLDFYNDTLETFFKLKYLYLDS